MILGNLYRFVFIRIVLKRTLKHHHNKLSSPISKTYISERFSHIGCVLLLNFCLKGYCLNIFEDKQCPFLISACKVEAAIGAYSPTRCIEQFLEDYYDLMDPEGVAERLRENRTVEAQFCDKEINYLGHLLVGDPAEFSRRLQETTSGVSAELVRFVGTFFQARKHAPSYRMKIMKQRMACAMGSLSFGRRCLTTKLCFRYGGSFANM